MKQVTTTESQDNMITYYYWSRISTGVKNILRGDDSGLFGNDIYDMLGRKVNAQKASKGIYIVGGKKVVVK